MARHGGILAIHWSGMVLSGSLLAIAGCKHHGGARRVVPAPSGEAGAMAIERYALDAPAPPANGLSDLTPSPGGGYLAIAERTRMIVPIWIDEKGAKKGAPFSTGPAIALQGVPDGEDTESMALQGGGRFAIGTERQEDGRASDDLLIGNIEDGHAVVSKIVKVDYSAWGGLRATKNHGLEAACSAGGRLFVGSESVIAEPGEAGRRMAPIGKVDVESGAIVPHRLRLTSRTGRLSALACRSGRDGAIEAFAIERHYGVMRILKFELPAGETGMEIEPQLYADLAPRLDPIPNLEGIAFGPGDELILISDNDTGGVNGPTEMVVLRPPATSFPSSP